LKNVKNNYFLVFNKLIILIRLAITNDNILSVLLEDIKDVYLYVYIHLVGDTQVSYEITV
jgi:hypothetical protein